LCVQLDGAAVGGEFTGTGARVSVTVEGVHTGMAAPER
jgi:hypothetical protein